MNPEEDVSEGQTQHLCTLHGAIHVMLLPDLVTDLRSNILSIKINVLAITVLFLYVSHSRAAKWVTSGCFQFTIKGAIFFHRKTYNYYYNFLIQLLILKCSWPSHQYFSQSSNSYEVQNRYVIALILRLVQFLPILSHKTLKNYIFLVIDLYNDKRSQGNLFWVGCLYFVCIENQIGSEAFPVGTNRI